MTKRRPSQEMEITRSTIDQALAEEREVRRTIGNRLRPNTEGVTTGDVDRLDQAMRAEREARKSSAEVAAAGVAKQPHRSPASLGVIAPLVLFGLAMVAMVAYAF